mgnify:CR=1 FL=1
MTMSLALTPGEPAGVGPDLLITLAQQKHQQQLIAYADPDMLMQFRWRQGFRETTRVDSSTICPLAPVNQHPSLVEHTVLNLLMSVPLCQQELIATSLM